MPPVKPPGNLPDLVAAAFSRAKASGDLTYYPTQVTILQANSIPFQLRFSPSLANKPENPHRHASSTPPKKVDPFSDPPSELVVVRPFPPAHLLVLNKFAVVPEHFILATEAFRAQTDLLEAGDLAAAYACIEAYGDAADGTGESRGELFVFFNSGPHSGASQPHRHLQLLPIERMREGLETTTTPSSGAGGSYQQKQQGGDAAAGGWDVLANHLLDPEVRARLPFQTFAERIDGSMTPSQLRDVYLSLYRQACRAAGHHDHADTTATQGEGPVASRISYNLAMTRRVMAVCPRTADGSDVLLAPGGGRIGRVSLNGTVLAGTALVKSEAEWEALRRDPGQLVTILGKIGIPTGS
ncbi:hypothetical protein VTK73DRAFT_7041 [Phialemonium thermophilum]|uniref:ATP adenylyltransferase n=1 Tax=Phialemonium thermophilum TaxID=223376 RepID=A0ABR3WGS4_9PEZI